LYKLKIMADIIESNVYSSVLVDKKSVKITEDILFANYFYLHGLLEDKNNYDCCYGNIHFFHNISTKFSNLTLVNVKSLNVVTKKIEEDLSICFYPKKQNSNTLIISLEDNDELEKLFKKQENIYTSFFDNEKKLIKEKNPLLWELIKSKI